MIEPQLSVGAVFEDGGLYYQVQSVLPDGNYISKRVEKTVKSVEAETKQETVKKSTRGRKKT